MDADVKEYRSHIVQAEQAAQEAFDKTVLLLSGGALGISFAFLRDFLGATAADKPSLLLGAWVLWAASLTSVLLSYYTSRVALRNTIGEVDRGEARPGVEPGGRPSAVTKFLNAASAALFILGVFAFVFFVMSNL